MHQNRPISAPLNLTLIHDTIQLAFAPRLREMTVKLAFLRRVAATSALIVTPSNWSRRQIVELLGPAPERVRVLQNPVDWATSDRVMELRRHSHHTGAPFALYVGRFAEHKNLPRLVAAFRESTFAREGGRLKLVGGTADECSRMAMLLSPSDRVDLVQTCPQDELERLFAKASFLVQPSLLEGYGMPVVEALTAGIPVCSSNAGALGEVVGDHGVLFDPMDVDDILRAIDETSAALTDPAGEDEMLRAERYRASSSTPVMYAEQFSQAVLDASGR